MNKRIVRTTDLSAFKQILMAHYHDLDNLSNKHLVSQIDKLSAGCFVIAYFVEGTNHVEALTMHVFQNRRMSLMIHKDFMFSLHMRYLSAEERAQCSHVLQGMTNKV